MRKQRRRVHKSEQALAAELQARRNEPTEWEEVMVEPNPNRGVLTSFRLPSNEFVELRKAAEASGETVSEFIRGAVALRLHGVQTITNFSISSGTQIASFAATIVAPHLSVGQTENPFPFGAHLPSHFEGVARTK